MPEELWRAAAEVARLEGLYSTSRALRVEYSRLKQRVTSNKIMARATTDSSFVELGVSQLCGACRTVVELSGRDGDRMRVEVTGTPTVDVVGLAQAFLSQRS
jgi:hypothetical protein